MAENKKKFAIRHLVRGPEGTMQVVFIDAQTGQVIQDTEGYQVITAGNTEDLDLSKDEEKKDTTAEKVIKETTQPQQGSSDSPFGKSSSSKSPTAEDNYGYINKPSWMNLASFAPGIFGLAGKAINTGVNVNNMSAANRAREELGIEERPGFIGNVKGVLGGPNPDIGEMTTPFGNQLDVSFQPQEPGPGFSVSPAEAEFIMSQDPSQTSFGRDVLGYTPGSGAGVPQPQPEQRAGGFMSRMTGLEEGWVGDRISSFADNIVSNIFSGANRPTSNYNTNYFPEAPARSTRGPSPSSPAGGAMAARSGGSSSPSFADMSSYSPSAAESISSGQTGLY